MEKDLRNINIKKGEKIKDCFIINKITESDVRANRLRILVNYKKYFPITDDGNSCTYDINIKVGTVTYDRKYRYIKKRSNILYLREELYRDILQIESGDKLIVVILERDELYQIINLRTLT